jgi:hypothetical protein
MVDKLPSTDVQFPGQHQEESFQFYFHQHWLRLFLPFMRLMGYNLVLIIIVFALFFIGSGPDLPDSRHFTIITITIIFLLLHLGFMVRFYAYFLYVIIITDRRVHRLKKTLLTIDDHQTMDLWMLQDIHKSQHGLVQNILHFGSLSLEAQETVMKLHFVPHITNVYSKIISLREQARPLLPVKPLRDDETMNGT